MTAWIASSRRHSALAIDASRVMASVWPFADSLEDLPSKTVLTGIQNRLGAVDKVGVVGFAAVDVPGGEDATDRPEDVARPRDAGAGEEAPQDPAIEDEDDEASEDPQHPASEEPTSHEIREVAEHEAARSDVDGSRRGEQPRAEPLTSATMSVTWTKRVTDPSAMNAPSTRNGIVLAKRWAKPECRNGAKGMPNNPRSERGRTPHESNGVAGEHVDDLHRPHHRDTATTAITGRSGSDSLGRSTSVDGCPGWRSISDDPLEAARLDLGRLTTGEHPLHMQLGGAPFDRVGEDVLDVGAVDEAVRSHVVDRVRLGEEVEHRLVPSIDDRAERVDHPDERLATLDHALVVERDVVVGLLVAHLGQARLEVVEIAPGVAVVRAETR